MNTEVENAVFSLYSKSRHDSSTEDQIFEKRSALEEVRGCEESLATFQEIMRQSPSECKGLQLQYQISGEKAAVKQTETEERQFGVQPNTEHSRNMNQLQNESSEEHEGCSRLKSPTNGETETDSQNEVEERQDDVDVFGEFLRTKTSLQADNTIKYGEFPIENCASYDTLTMQGYNSSHDVLANIINKEIISEPTAINSAESGGGSAYKEGAVTPPGILMNSEQVPEPIHGSLGYIGSASIQPAIPMKYKCIQDSDVISFEYNASAFIQPLISVPSIHTFESTEGKFGYNESSFTQPEISVPSAYTPTSCGKTTDNLLSDDQHEMTNGLGSYSGALNQEIKADTKRKNSEKDTQTKKCKGEKSKQSEAEKRRKNADKSKLNREKKKLEIVSLKNKVETLQKQNQEKDRIITEKNRIITNLTQNQGLSESFPKNSPSDRSEFDEEEFTEMMHQAEVEAFDPEKFLKIMNNWFKKKGMSEINDKEPTAGAVRVEGGERNAKILVLKSYWERKSDKERNKKFRDDLEHNGLE